jgi:D-tyrosyl-tRNA(Tyr) deacylase
MRAVVQRVERARVTVEERPIAETGKGILIFLGIAAGDNETDADYLLEKIINLRIFEDEKGKMNLSLLDINGEMLVVSQFTLLGDCRNGRRPSFTEAEKPEQALFLYEYLVSQATKRIRVVAKGEFQAMMKVQLVNDGPVTMLLDSKRKF